MRFHNVCTMVFKLGLDVLHGIPITSGTSYLGHKPRIIGILVFDHTNAHINDGFIHQELRTTHRTAIRILDGRWPKGFIAVFSSLRHFYLSTHIVPDASPRARHTPHRTSDATPSIRPSHGGKADRATDHAQNFDGSVPDSSWPP